MNMSMNVLISVFMPVTCNNDGCAFFYFFIPGTSCLFLSHLIELSF